jgi:hypothetical protein
MVHGRAPPTTSSMSSNGAPIAGASALQSFGSSGNVTADSARYGKRGAHAIGTNVSLR